MICIVFRRLLRMNVVRWLMLFFFFQDMKIMKDGCKIVTVLQPRYLHLVAYQSALRWNFSDAKTKLQKCLQAAKSVENELEVRWAEHSLDHWFNPDIHRVKSETWVSHVMSEEGEQYSDWELNGREVNNLAVFTLPMPDWYERR